MKQELDRVKANDLIKYRLQRAKETLKSGFVII